MLDKKEAQLNSMSVEDKYDYSRKLIKQATSYKNSDIEKAINLIKKAIDICPEKVLSDYFKLSNYYFIAEQKEKSYSIHKDLLDSFNERDLGMFNMNKSQIYEKLCSLSYTDKQYENYLQNYCLWLYNSVIAFASQGRKVELENILKAENKLNFLSPSKVKGSFKKMKIETRMEIFNDKLVVYFERISEILTEMVNIAYTGKNISIAMRRVFLIMHMNHTRLFR